MTREEYLEMKDLVIKKEDIIPQLVDLKYAVDQATILTITDKDGKILYVNDQFCKVIQYSKEELLANNHRMLNSGYHSKEYYKNLWETVISGNVWRGVLRNKAKDGSYIWLDTTIVPFLDKDGKPYQYISIRDDVTEKKQVEEELKESEEKYRLITENTSDIITVINRDGNIMYITPSSYAVLGHNIEDIEHSKFLRWVHKNDRENVTLMVKTIFKGRKSFGDVEFRMRKKDGSFLSAEAKISAVLDDEGNEVGTLVLVIRDITLRKHSEKMIYHLSHHDTLTGLPNRAFFMNHLSKEFYHAKVIHDELAVLYLDVDRFKNINDSLGHEKGDTVLTEIANRLRTSIHAKDFVARIGGDEFVILLSRSTRDEVIAIADKIVESLQNPITVSKNLYTVTGSIGISVYPSEVKTPEELLKQANIASDTVKAKGRNSYLFFHKNMEERSLERILLENEMKKAIKLDQFTLEYQPKIDIKSGKLIGMEALVRWNHPELGKIPPGKFIPIAEETGLITVLGEVILRKGCEQTHRWQEEGYTDLVLSVNLSTKQLYQNDLIEKIKLILRETNLDSKWLELEVTETAFTNIDNAQSILQEIRDLGIQVSIDDFGAGYSSFSYLKNLPVNTLKIDASFIRDIDLNKESQAIVNGIVDIAEKLKLNVIAEGIETVEQLDQLKDAECPQGQGYYFSKPLTADTFHQFLKKEHRLTFH
ncbi:EAL domain-containing protein [Oceanobacillus bengalensis]|uniref:EAL domain-containing protein n=2 Tax=Oceanobacillus bengalensis TaxID=1435466 RepID=A0A494Z1N9_9BACI|nr:EAL domain-containing protein [Oceanobacillus bengalensis]